MTLCMQVQAGDGGIIRHLGSPEDWQQILTGAATIRRLSDIPMGPYNALYQVEDSSEQRRQYIVQEPAVDGMADEPSHHVRVGSWVGVREGDSKETWRVVALEESDPMRGCISEDSPLGRALLGHMVGDVVRVRGPKGSWSVTVLAIWWDPADELEARRIEHDEDSDYTARQWRLRLRDGPHHAAVAAKVLDHPARLGCPAGKEPDRGLA